MGEGWMWKDLESSPLPSSSKIKFIHSFFSPFRQSAGGVERSATYWQPSFFFLLLILFFSPSVMYLLIKDGCAHINFCVSHVKKWRARTTIKDDNFCFGRHQHWQSLIPSQFTVKKDTVELNIFVSAKTNVRYFSLLHETAYNVGIKLQPLRSW